MHVADTAGRRVDRCVGVDRGSPGASLDRCRGAWLRSDGVREPKGIAVPAMLRDLPPGRLLPRRGRTDRQRGEGRIDVGRLAPGRIRHADGTVVWCSPSAGDPRRPSVEVSDQMGWLGECEHGVSTQCLERHAAGDFRIGQALCPDCYDYEAAAVWNAAFGALWRRTVTYLPREFAALARLSVRVLRSQVRVTYAKVAEFQARGVVHVHTVVRLDGPDGPETAPTAWATAQRLAEAVGRAAARVSVTVEGSSGRELVVRWGEQIDVRPITPDLADGSVSQTAVAGYIAKYATKDAQVAGGLDRRIRYARQIDLADVTEHARRLMSSAWGLSPRWAHSFGFRGHFLTKGRRYSVTFRALRGARAAFRAAGGPVARRGSDQEREGPTSSSCEPFDTRDRV